MDLKILSYSIVGGVVVTLLTGFFLNTPPMLMGAVRYGYPFAWLIRLVIAPKYFPWKVNVLNLIADVVVWTVIIGIIVFASIRVKK